MLAKCENCVGQCDPVIEAAIDSFERVIDEGPEIDGFEALSNLNTIVTGDRDKIIKLAQQMVGTPMADVSLQLYRGLEQVNCNAQPRVVTARLMVRLTQRAAEAVLAEEAEEELRRGSIDRMLEEYRQKNPDSRLNRPVTQESTAVTMETERNAFIAQQGWDPENLSFVERLEIKDHLRSKGFKV